MINSGNDSLKAQLKQAFAEIKQLREENKEQRALIEALQEQNKLFAQMLFGSSSEKAEKILPDDHLDTASANDDSKDDPEPDPSPGGGSAAGSNGKPNGTEKKPKGKGGRNKLPKHLPRVIRRLDFDSHCHCGCKYRIIGQHIVEKLAVLPAMYYVIQFIHKHTACPKCDDQISCAKAEPSIIPNSQATPELLAHIAISKTADGLPIYRQEKQADRQDCPISRDKLNRWFIQLGFALTCMVNLIADRYNSYCVGGVDETGIQVIQEPGKTAYQRSYLFTRYGGPPNQPVMLVDYRPHKNQETVNELLEPFEGTGLVADMYAAFVAFADASPGITLYACHDHIRRKFVEALNAIPKKAKKDSLAYCIVELYKSLYAIEVQAKGRSPRVIKKIRRRSRKILNRIYKVIESTSVRPKSKLGQAIEYAIKNKPAAYAYLTNPYAPISNIMTEHVAKKIAVARKNFMFCFSVKGATALANIMSLVYTAELYPEHNLNDYLTAVFTELPKAQTLEDIEALLPWNFTPHQVSNIIQKRPRPKFENVIDLAA